MSAPQISLWKEPVKLGLISTCSGVIAYYSYFVHASMGPVFWLLLLVACGVVSSGAGICGIAIGGIRVGIQASKQNDWVGILLSLSGVILSAISINRAIDALKNW